MCILPYVGVSVKVDRWNLIDGEDSPISGRRAPSNVLSFAAIADRCPRFPGEGTVQLAGQRDKDPGLDRPESLGVGTPCATRFELYASLPTPRRGICSRLPRSSWARRSRATPRLTCGQLRSSRESTGALPMATAAASVTRTTEYGTMRHRGANAAAVTAKPVGCIRYLARV